MAFTYKGLTDNQCATLRAVQANGRKGFRPEDAEGLIELGLIVRRQAGLVLTSKAYAELRLRQPSASRAA